MRGSDLQLPRSTQLSTDMPVDTVFLGISMMGILAISMMGGQVAEQATQLPSDPQASSFSRDIALQQRTESDQATAQAHAQVKQAVGATAPQARQSLEEEQRPERGCFGEGSRSGGAAAVPAAGTPTSGWAGERARGGAR